MAKFAIEAKVFEMPELLSGTKTNAGLFNSPCKLEQRDTFKGAVRSNNV